VADFKTGVEILPLNGRVLVKMIEDRKSAGGIILPDTAGMNFQLGKVVEISNGVLENGVLYGHNVEINDEVLFHSNSGYPVDIDGVRYKILPEKEIMAVILTKIKTEEV
jgi:chaperonin GroES